MRFLLVCAMTLVLGVGAVLADGHSHSTHSANIYPVHTTHNYCPAGLQPVTLNGVICCGQPNQSVSYAHMLRHGATRAARVACPVGQKGCN